MNEVEVVQEGNAGKQLLCKLLDVRAGKWHETVGLEKVEDTLTVQVCDDADVVAEVEAISKVNAAVDVVFVVGGERGQHT